MRPPLSTPSPTSIFRPFPITSNPARRYMGRDSLGRHVQIQQLLEPSPTLHGSNPLWLRLKRPRAVRLSRRISHLPAVGSNRGIWVDTEDRGDRTLRSGEISADLRRARRSAISASASPAPLKSKVPVGLVGLGEIGEGKREEGGRERERGAAAWATSWPEGDARSEACTRTQTRTAAA